MRAVSETEGNELLRKATHLGRFVGAHVLHASATAVLLWTFLGPVGPWPVKAAIGLVVGAPWLVWLVMWPWTVRDLVGALSRRPVAREAVGDENLAEPARTAGIELEADRLVA